MRKQNSKLAGIKKKNFTDSLIDCHYGKILRYAAVGMVGGEGEGSRDRETSHWIVWEKIIHRLSMLDLVQNLFFYFYYYYNYYY